MFTVFEIRGDNLCCGSCELPAGSNRLCFVGGLSVWLLGVPDDHVQPAGPRDVVAIVSRSPAVEPYATVTSWVVRQRADRQFRRHGRWRATVRCVRLERLYIHSDAGEHVAWVARRYRVPVLRASVARRSSSARAGSGSAEATTTSCSAIDHATHETADGERRLSYRRNAAEIAELVGHKLRAWL
ncbi:MAG: hypothetical protein KatS3mg038_3209 [Candidatus Kapaibacterium sp.]|nr:MAG: hypothetical protein KatS3mg038_3209 [Candidatus Kapabacteria bacterium]